MSALRTQLDSVARLIRNPRAVPVALVILWAMELFLVQEVTLHEFHYYAFYQPFLHRAVRASLDLLACAMLVTLLPRFLLGISFVVSLALAGMVLSFENYSGRPLSASLLTSTAGEGISVFNAAVALLPFVFYLLVVTLAIKVFLLLRLRRSAALPLPRRLARTAKLAGCYVAIIAVLNVYKPFTLLLRWESVGGIGSLYGYTPTWAAELLLLDQEEILKRAVERSRVTSDRLGVAGEADFPTNERVVFLQVESLDSAVLDHKVDGRPVAPELERLAERSMSYLIRSEKKTGSCDADFTVVMCALPSQDMPNYKIPGFSFANSFIHQLQKWGYTTSAVHSVKGAFFNIREAFTKIGFDHLFFLEELAGAESLPFSTWAILDHDLLNWSATRLTKSQGKQFYLVITATSHVPFQYTPAKYREFFKGNDALVPGYLDSIHYVDQAIGAFVRGLPEGTILIIYGDHGSYLSSKKYDYENAKYEGVPLVPFLVHQVGNDIHTLQRTRDSELANSGELTLLDMVTYTRAVLQRQNLGSANKQPNQAVTP